MRYLTLKILGIIVAILWFASVATANDIRLQNNQIIHDIAADLRCLVCQNQTVADSDSAWANDIRNLIHERMVLGEDATTIKHYMRARFGNFILMTPPFNTHTILLWFAPLIILLLGLAIIAYFMRTQYHKKQETMPLSEQEQKRLDDIL